MENTPVLRQVNWPLVVGLAAVGLVRPLLSIVGITDALGRPATPLVLTVVITVVWVLVVGLSRVRQPLLTLVFAGIGYGLLAALISVILSPLLTGEMQGVGAVPFAIIPILITNALWGLVAGGLAVLLRRVRGTRTDV
ncbi:hypothetical protein [Microlunatus sp. Y2014]|uniref:hypothetical protein n=1 Tax=Microlunatus sp. Y2014 TaxID=3418488 RepID=UPI003DA77FC2